MNKVLRKSLKTILFLIFLSPLAWLVFGLWSDTVLGTVVLTVDPVQKLNRELGYWTLIFLIITLSVRPLAEILNQPLFLGYRRMAGLFSFFYAFLHLVSYIAIDLQFSFDHLIKDISKRAFIIAGIISIIALVPLAATSNKKMMKRLGGKNWRRLHWLIYPVSILATVHFYMMIKADFSRPFLYILIISLLILYRIIRYFSITRLPISKKG